MGNPSNKKREKTRTFWTFLEYDLIGKTIYIYIFIHMFNNQTIDCAIQNDLGITIQFVDSLTCFLRQLLYDLYDKNLSVVEWSNFSRCPESIN